MIDRLLRRQRSFFLLLAVMVVIGFLAFEFASSGEVALAILLILEEVPLIMLWVFITAPRLRLQVQDQFFSLLDDELDPWQARQRLKQERLEDLLDAQNMLSLCDLLEGKEQAAIDRLQRALCQRMPKSLRIQLLLNQSAMQVLVGQSREARDSLQQAQQLLSACKKVSLQLSRARDTSVLLVAHASGEQDDASYMNMLRRMIVIESLSLRSRMMYRYLLGMCALRHHDQRCVLEQLAWLERFAPKTCFPARLRAAISEAGGEQA